MIIDKVADLALVTAAIGAGVIATAKWGRSTLAYLRTTEWPENEKSEPLSRPVLHWTIAHVRDDVGMIFIALTITNGLLAGILVLMALQAIR